MHELASTPSFPPTCRHGHHSEAHRVIVLAAPSARDGSNDEEDRGKEEKDGGVDDEEKSWFDDEEKDCVDDDEAAIRSVGPCARNPRLSFARAFADRGAAADDDGGDDGL
jgi:hypothetical protein